MGDEYLERLTIEIGSLVAIHLPDADLVFAQMSLPFAGSKFEEATANALPAIRHGGVFAGHFFGVIDDWIDGQHATAAGSTLKVYGTTPLT